MRPRILFVHSGNEAFIKIDLELLNISFDVQDFYAARKFPHDFFRYLRLMKENSVLYCWFASWNSFWALLLAKILNKPSILVIGGYDLANLPDIGYGHQRHGMQKWMSRFAMNLASMLITNSYYSQKEAQQNAKIPPERVSVIHHGVPDKSRSYAPAFKERMVLSVGKVDWPNLKRKGLEPFVRAAADLPDVEFVVVGAWADDSIQFLRSIAPTNVTFTGWVSSEEILDYYRRASVYVQPSLHEGFGLSVAEAMLAGCIPVVTRLGSLPEVVGDCGVYIDSPKPLDISKAADTALNSSLSSREQARERIFGSFSHE